jgi:hypothetical protein
MSIVGRVTNEGTEYKLFDLMTDLDRLSTLEVNDGSIKDTLYGGLEIRLPGTNLPLESFGISNSLVNTVTFSGNSDGTLSVQREETVT